MAKVDAFLARRRTIARRYDQAFASLGAVRPLAADHDQSAVFLYVVRVPAAQRQGFRDMLKQRGVDTGVHYPLNHRQPFFQSYASAPLPRVERIESEIVSLPMFAGLTDAEVETVVTAVQAFHNTPLVACRG